MNGRLSLTIFFLGLFLSACPLASAADLPRIRTVQLFDTDWRFLKEDTPGAEQVNFNDASWRKLDVPHDWSIEGPYPQSPGRGGQSGYLPAGVGWYRKTFALPAADSARRVFIDFEGVMYTSDVWINGFHLGKRPFGYMSFRYDMTGHLNFGEGKTNVLAVRADNSRQPNSRWYTGSGIYRHVRLVIADPVHVENWGTFIATPQVGGDSATIHIASSVINQSDAAKDVTIQTSIIGPDGKVVQTAEAPGKSVPAGEKTEFTQDIKVASPKLWSTESPNLYQAMTSIRVAGKPVDDNLNTFGIRNPEFKTDTGFWLNGKNMKILGACLHQDGGAFGAAVPLGVWERRLNTLRELGVNAIRCSHNPPDPAFLDLCDRMGFLVMDEIFDCWTVGKTTNDYHLYFKDWWQTDTRDTVMRDRNHPSIILYSAGNEIHDTPKEDLAKSILRPLVDEFHKWDPTRPVTQALFRPNVSHDYTNGLADMLDVVGTNYRDNELLEAWKAHPGWKIIGTEQRQELETWLWLRDNPQHSGQFIWAGVDYLGESIWPETTYYNGLLDRAGQIKSQGYERQAWWSSKPMVKIFRSESAGARGRGAVAGPTSAPLDDAESGGSRGAAPAATGGARGIRAGGPPVGAAPVARGPVSNWTAREGTAPGQTTITVYSNCDELELFVNDKSLGMKPKNANDATRTWTSAFEPGVIKAVGKNKGQIVASDELRTASKPVRIMLTADSKNLTPTFDDVTFVTATIVDENGAIQPYADQRITFKVSGRGVVAAVDNGDRADHDPYQAADRKAYQGKAIAMIKANAASGDITVSASAEGLQSSTVTINARPAAK